MPDADADSETSAYYKQLLTRPLSAPTGVDTAENKLLAAFSPLCEEIDGHGLTRHAWAHTAWTQNWVRFSERQECVAMEGRRRLLDRFEWQSVWETSEVQQHWLQNK